MLSKIIYASRATDLMEFDALTALLTVSRKNNERAGITGLLVHCDGSFLQLLEGEAAALDDVYSRINQDERHHSLRLLARSNITRRRFAEWSMSFENLDAAQLADLLPGYRIPSQAPLVDAGLISSGIMADALLGRFASARL